MIQSIYAEVSNGNQVRCGKRVPKYLSVPIPLMKSNYLGEFRTLLEKAKARKNLGIGDAYTLAWGNITGHIEDNEDLIRFIEQQWQYNYISPYIQQEIHNVKEALDYALYYVSTYESNDQQVQALSLLFDILTSHVNEIQSQLQEGISTNLNHITDIESAIRTINQQISDINLALITINVDKNIHDWIENNLSQSTTIEFKEVEGEDETTFEIIEIKISQLQGNILEVKEDGLYVKSYDQDINSLSGDVSQIQLKQQETDQALVDLKYRTTLPDSTTSPVHEGVTVELLKNKSMSEILDQILFPADIRELVEPSIEYEGIVDLLEINSPVQPPQVYYLLGDAGETVAASTTLMFNNQNYEGDYYDQAGTYIYTTIIQYEAGEYLKNNRGETTDIRVEAGAVSTTMSIRVTYPWYAGDETGVIKQELVPIGEPSGILDFSLTKHAVVKIPGSNSFISSFKLDSGLGYLDVDMSGWEQSLEQINGITYKVYTKIDEYVAVLPHRINFTINI